MKKDNLFEREIAENEAWFNGSSTVLENFFKIERPKYEVVKMFDNKPTFWNSVSGDVPRVHSGLPALISKTWVRLINPRDVEITINNEAAQERWNAIAKDNRFYTRIMPQLIVTMSWGGYAVLKLSRDDKGDIIEVVNPKYARVKEERGRIVGYDFEIYENGLVIVEHYEPGRVWYEAFEEVQNRRTKVPVPEGYKDFEYSGDYIPALLFNNTPYNSRFPELIYGESDYSNIHALLHQLDSVLSHTQLDVEAGKATKFVNEDLVKTDEFGNEYFDKNETVIRLASALMQDPGFDLKKMIMLLQPSIRVEQFNATAKEITGRILANTGLSAVSVGLPGFDAIDAAADSQRARKETSIVSRNEKVATLTELLQEFINIAVNIDAIIGGGKIVEHEIDIEFDKYGAPTWEDLIDVVVKAVQGNVMSTAEAVDILFEGRSDEDKLKIIRDIKSEGLIPFTASDLDENPVE